MQYESQLAGKFDDSFTDVSYKNKMDPNFLNKDIWSFNSTGMQLIDELYRQIPNHLLAEAMVICKNSNLFCVQHLLETEVPVFKGLVNLLGMNPQNMFVAGKCYSTFPQAVQQIKKMGIYVEPTLMHNAVGDYRKTTQETLLKLWGKFSLSHQNDTIIVLDEGGRSIENIPHNLLSTNTIIGIEQTQAGINNGVALNQPIPMVMSATSAVKKLIEAPLIANAVATRLFSKIKSIKHSANPVYGIVGVGALGSRMAELFAKQGVIVWLYDKDQTKLNPFRNQPEYRIAHNIEEMVEHVNILGGFTGKDISKEYDFTLCKHDLVLYSGSSEDKEYRTFLKRHKDQLQNHTSPLDNLSVEAISGHSISVLYGGFPVNFSDRGAYSVPHEEIAVTRALMWWSCAQAAIVVQAAKNGDFKAQSHRRIMVEPRVQKIIADYAFKIRPELYPKTILEAFANLETIKENSQGEYIDLCW